MIALLSMKSHVISPQLQISTNCML